MTKVLILGASGMLGSAVLKAFTNFDGQVVATQHSTPVFNSDGTVEFRTFDALADQIFNLASDFGPNDYIINCIGLVKAHIQATRSSDILRAINLNAVLPYKIEKFASHTGTRVIQIATDCVFSGSKGNYQELDVHDATDVYGKTKSLGEVNSPLFMHLRVSIIGPELSGHTSLYDWVRFQPSNASIEGYTDHIWNGITANSFARITRGVIEANTFTPGVHHVLPQDHLSKYVLVSKISESLGRGDISITPVTTKFPVNRSLATIDPQFNEKLWRDAGYPSVPTIQTILVEIRN